MSHFESELLTAIAMAFALSVDSFAVTLGALSAPHNNLLRREFLFHRTALAFAVIQTLMFAVGFFLGKSSLRFFNSIDHYLAASILAFLAFKTWQSRDEAIWDLNATEKRDFGLELPTTVLAALATSLDAFGAGTGSAFSDQSYYLLIVSIFVITGLVVWIALHAGHKISPRLHKKLPYFSSIALIAIAVKILVSHGHPGTH